MHVENWLAANAITDHQRFDAAQPRQVQASGRCRLRGGFSPAGDANALRDQLMQMVGAGQIPSADQLTSMFQPDRTERRHVYRVAPASRGARRLLSSAARTLRTADPVEVLGDSLDESLSLPPGAEAYRRPHAFETRFSERAPRALALDLTPTDPQADPAASRRHGASHALGCVHRPVRGPGPVLARRAERAAALRL